jgi:hypothetical protein
MSLPELLKYFPEDREEILLCLFLLLLNPWEKISAFALQGILNGLWEISFKDAHSIFIGYLFLKKKYDGLKAEVRKESYEKGVYEISEKQVVERFEQQYEKELDNIVSNNVSIAARQ